MKTCRKQRYYLLAGVSLMLLAACEPQIEADNTEKALAESDALRKSGNALIKKGELPEAIAIFDKLINMDPQNYLAYNGKAVAFDYGGNHLAAQDLYQMALSLSPDYLPVKNNLAMSLLLNGQVDQAIILLESLVGVKADNPSASNIVRHNLALAYGITGQRGKATKLNLQDMTPEQAEENLRYYERYITNNPNKGKKGKKSERYSRKNNQNIGFITSSPLKLIVHPEQPKPQSQSKTANAAEGNKGDFFENSVTYSYPK